MKTEFNGKYFNGISSKPNACIIKLKEHAITIYLSDDNGHITENINWILDDISKDDIEISDAIRLKYGKFPHQSIVVNDKDFSSSLNQLYPYYSFSKRDVGARISKNWKLIIGLFLILVAFGIFSFEVIIPNIAEYAATQVPLSVEKSIGESAYKQITAFTSTGEEKSILVQQFFEETHIKHNYQYNITVLNSDIVNAFALPGGRIAVYSGILDKINTPEELAALLAHESSHVELQHSLKSIFRTLSGYFVISLLFGDMGGITAAVFENGYMFQHLQYSRKMEKEADLRGLESMNNAGINPNGMLELFNTINQNTPESIEKYELSEFLSTHPLTKHRITYIKEYIDINSNQYINNPKLDSLFILIKK